MLKAMGMGTDGMSRRTLAVVVAILMLFATLVAVPGGPLNPTEAQAAPLGVPAGNSVEQHYAWNPNTNAWSTGQPKLYTEGDTAPFRVTLNSGAQASTQYYFSVCLDVNLSPPYAFTGFDDFDTTFGGVVNTPSPSDGYLEAGIGNFRGVNLDIDQVEGPTMGGFGCTAAEFGMQISYTMHADLTPHDGLIGAIVYGGIIAAPGATLPQGGTVGAGEGAASINGVFQADLAEGGSGAKTVNFKGSDIIPAAPGVDIEKSTNGEDADTAPGPFITLGDPVTWEYLVTNTGETELVNIAVTDDVLGAITCPQDTLGIGESMTCTANGTASAGQYQNIGTVTAEPPDRPEDEVTDQDLSHYYGVAGGLAVEKATNGVDADLPQQAPNIYEGEDVTWTYVVTNTSNQTVTNISLSDDIEGAITCPETELAPTESMECSHSGTATAGLYSNLATASGMNAAGDPVDATDPSHYFGVNGGLTIEKATNGEDADTPQEAPYIPAGDPVTWTYEVTNTSNATTTNIVVTDDQGVTVTCQKFSLAPGESMTCTANGTAIAGAYANVGEVEGEVASGQTVTDSDPSHYFGMISAIMIEKATNGDDADSAPGPYITVGNPVTWTYVVTNEGNVPLENVVVTDDQGEVPVLMSGDTNNDGFLDTDETWTYEAAGVAAAGQYTNLGTVQATDPNGNTVGDNDPSNYFGVDSSIDIEKSTNDEDADDPTGPNIAVGATVNWEYRVTNTGNADLTNLVVTDDQGVIPVLDASSDDGSDGILSPGEVWVYEASGAAVAGQYANLGIAQATDPVGNTVGDTDMSHYFGVAEGSLAIVKLVDNLEGGWVSDAVYPNGLETIVWQISVSNDGVGLLENVTLTDAFEASCETAFETAMTTAGFEDGGSFFLPEGEGVTFECQSTVGGFIGAINTASTQGEDILGRQVGPVESTATVTRVAPSATIGDTVFADENGNGIQDGEEKGIANADVRLTLPDNSTVITSTNVNGLYLFSALLPGDYKVELILSSIPEPADGELKITTASSFNVTLADGEAFLDADFGVQAILPKTGFNSEDVARFGLTLLLLGLMAVLVTRRKETGEES